MNLQLSPQPPSVRVLIVNPLCSCSRLIVMKILNGIVFGKSTPIDLILLVYSNEQLEAESFKAELIGCAFTCLKSITVTIGLPRYTDADVFCVVTNFINPNSFSSYRAEECDEQFDMLYLVLKLAHHWSKFPLPTDEKEDSKPKIKCKEIKQNTLPKKAIVIADGLVTLHILKSIAKVLPPEVLFCTSPICTIVKHVLGDYLKVGCPNVNEMHIWAADDQIFHIAIEEPIIFKNEQNKSSGGEGEPNSTTLLKDQIQRLNLDYTQFNESWMKTHFINKVSAMAAKNPYGNISRAAEFCATLSTIWSGHTKDLTADQELHTNVGVVSDGAFDTLKGHPYVFPVIFRGNKWYVDERRKDCSQLRLEIKRLNKAVRDSHSTLVSYCKEFLERNVINQEFIAVDQESTTLASTDTCEQMKL